ncbi:MAG: PD-(D/E)XK nuclease family protein [Nitrospirae bacterium]|nr:PD-(D/E)XK nuclease family protein [Nitrospirota bacterium]
MAAQACGLSGRVERFETFPLQAHQPDKIEAIAYGLLFDDMIKVFYTPPEYRWGTRMLLEEAAGHAAHPDYSDILYLAPSPVKASDAQKSFHHLQGGTCYLPPETTTISRYCKRMYSGFGSGRVLSRPLVPLLIAGQSRQCGRGLGESGQDGPSEGRKTFRGALRIGLASVIADFIDDLKQRFPGKTADELLPEFSRMFEALNVPGSVAANVIDALGTYKEYEVFAGQHGLVDEGDILKACSNNPEQCAHKGILVLDGFYDPSAAEKNVLAFLISNARQVFITVPHGPSCYGLTKDYEGFLRERFQAEEIYVKSDVMSDKPPAYYSYSDSEEEVEGIARQIKSLYVTGRVKSFESMVVAFPDIHSYAAMVERVFSRYGIPYVMEGTKNLGAMRPLHDILCLMAAVSEDYPRLKFAQFLSSRYFKKMPEHLNRWMPFLSIRSGIVAGKSAWLDFMAEGSEVLDVRAIAEREAIEKELLRFFKKLQPLEEIKGGAGYIQFAEIIMKLLEDLEFTVAPDEPDSNIRKKTSEALNDIFEQLSFLGALNPSSVTLTEFEEIFRHLLSSTFVEAEDVGVRVLDFRQLQGLSPEYLFFGGLVDGVIPGRQQMDYLLPDSVRARMGLMHLDKYTMIQKFIFDNSVKSAVDLHLSYPLMSGDTPFLPSSFLYSGEELKGGIGGIFSTEEYFVRIGRQPLLDIIDEVRVPVRQHDSPASFRVTDIDAYRACPRKFFIEKILNLTPAKVKEYEVEAATLGTIIHRAMERLVCGSFDDLESLTLRAGEIIADIMKDRKIDAYWKQLISDTFVELIPEIREMELLIRKEGYQSSEVEKSISGGPVSGIRLRGKIDRIDFMSDGVQIIDYKTGAAGLNCSQALEGNENLQLFLYAAMLKSQGLSVSRVGIYSLKDMMIKWCPPSSGGLKRKSRSGSKSDGVACPPRASIDDYVAASIRFLEDAVGHIKKGDFTARPLNDAMCRNCHEAPFCPYIQR